MTCHHFIHVSSNQQLTHTLTKFGNISNVSVLIIKKQHVRVVYARILLDAGEIIWLKQKSL